MSYWCQISFKTIEDGDIFSFFTEFKRKVGDNLEVIAENNFSFSPFSRRSIEYVEDEKKKREIHKEVEAWASRVFQYRYFYIPEHKLLGVFSVPDCIKDLFDLTHEFQNSCEQDYDFDSWNGIPIFESIANKWENISKESLAEAYRERYDDDTLDIDALSDEKIKYYSKDLCYDEIWKNFCEEFLQREESIVYMSLYGFYDILPIQRFVKVCYDKYIEWHKKVVEEIEKKAKEKEANTKSSCSETNV